MSKRTGDQALTITLGREELVIRRRYETASIFNDFLIAVWFVAGSILFLVPAVSGAAAWLFVVGSVQFLLRPTIRLAHRFHLQRIPQSRWES